MIKPKDSKPELPLVLCEMILAMVVVAGVAMLALASLKRTAKAAGRPQTGLSVIGMQAPGRASPEAQARQRNVTGRLKQQGAVSESGLKLADRVGKHAAAVGEQLAKTPEGREAAVRKVTTMSGAVRASSAEEIKRLLVDEQQLKALSDPDRKDIDVDRAKIQSIKKIVRDGKPVMIITLVDPHNRTQELEITDPKEQKDFESAHKIYDAAERNPVLKGTLDITNYLLQLADPKPPEPKGDEAKQPAKKETKSDDGQETKKP